MKELTWSWLIELSLGGFFVLVSSAARLDSPFANRSYTTFQRYVIAFAYYALGYLGVYYMLATLASWCLHSLNVGGVFEFLLASPPWLALLIVLIVPRFPYLSAIDRAFREHARYIGGIPFEAIRLRKEIPFCPSG